MGVTNSSPTVNVPNDGKMDEDVQSRQGSGMTLTDRIKMLLPKEGEETPKYSMDPVPTLFRWPYGGKLVYIAGSFNDWKGKVPMRREGPTDNPQFTISLDLRPGTYYYKFIVDDQWQHDPAVERMVNMQGVVNNVVEVRPLAAPGDIKISPLDAAMGEDGFGQAFPRPGDFSAEPPPIPPQLGPPRELAASAPPLHVTLQHARFENTPVHPAVRAVAITQRFRPDPTAKLATADKFVTTVVYTPRRVLAAGAQGSNVFS